MTFEWYNEWHLMTMSGTTIDNKWQQVTTTDSNWKWVVMSIKVLFCQQYGVGINIFKMERLFFITEATANSSRRCTQNLSKFIHSLSFDVPQPFLCINDLRELCKRYPRLTTRHCVEIGSGTSAVHVQFYISDLLTSDLQFWISN